MSGALLADVEKVHAFFGAKHIWKSKCTKHTIPGALLEVVMLKKYKPLWREAHVALKMHKTTSAWEHFSKLRCWKSARRCGAKHIWKSKCTKHTMPGAFLEVEMWKKGTPLRREAHFEVKNAQNTPRSEHFWKLRCSKSARRCGAKRLSKSECARHRMFAPHLDVEASFCVASARGSPPCQKRAKNLRVLYT